MKNCLRFSVLALLAMMATAGRAADNIAAFKALETGTEATLTLTNAQVLYAAGNDIFVRDATGAIDFYSTGLGYTQNQVLNGTVTGKLDAYQNMPELVKGDNFAADVTATDGAAAEPVIITIDQANADYECDLVTIKGLTLRKDGNNWYGDKGDLSIQIYDKFKLKYTPTEGQTVDVTGIIIPYKTVYELAPITDFTEGQEPEETGTAFVPATTIESGKAYILVANDGEGLKVGTPITGNYGYIQVADATETDGVIRTEEENAYIIEAADGGYTIKQSDGRYLYQTGTYNSFNVTAEPTEGHVWTIETSDGGNGTFVITNTSVNKYIQYSIKYTSYGSYASAQDNAVMPMLYVKSDSTPNAISTVQPGIDASAPLYDLSGRRVANPTRGLYIQNGRKVVVK